jgi:hypothetical protein
MSIRPTDHLLPHAPSGADRKAIRAFCRGVVIGALGTALLGGLAVVLS